MLSALLLGSALSMATLLPVAWKWKLDVGRMAMAIAGLGVVMGVLTHTAGTLIPLGGLRSGQASSLPLRAGLDWLLTVAAAISLLLYRFFRDPERTIPDTPHIVVSPADGEVLYVHESREGILPVSTKWGRSYTLAELTRTPLQMNEATVIGIGISLLDAHVNRAPIAGRVVLRRHFPGRFGSLRKADMVFRNERMTTIIERDDVQVAIVQIASRLVRQIVSFVKQDQELALGQRIGAIRLGSQVDLVLPCRPDLRVTVQPGAILVAGQSVVAIFEERCVANPAAATTGPGSR